jgi:Fimbrial assembly protein (PilN)
MKQQINLYPAEEKPNLVPSFYHIMVTSAAFFAFLMLISIFSMIGRFQDRNDLKKLEIEEADLQQKYAALEQKIPSPKVKEELEKQIKYLEDMRNSSQVVLSIISTLQSDQFRGFSGYLKALSEQTIPGLWLTRFNFQSEGLLVTLEGKAIRPELVPKLIENLGKESIYGGKTFQIFKMALDPKTQQLNFILSPEQASQK